MTQQVHRVCTPLAYLTPSDKTLQFTLIWRQFPTTPAFTIKHSTVGHFIKLLCFHHNLSVAVGSYMQHYQTHNNITATRFYRIIKAKNTRQKKIKEYLQGNTYWLGWLKILKSLRNITQNSAYKEIFLQICSIYIYIYIYIYIHRVIHKSLRDFRTRLRNNQERHGRKEHINR